VRAHIATCEVCGAELRELQATQQMLRAMPVQVPPRVFMLTEEMVGARSRSASTSMPSILSRLFDRALAPRLATGSVLAFALLLVMLVSDLGVLNRGALAPMANTTAKLATESDTQEASTQRNMAGPTSTTAAVEMLPMVAPSEAPAAAPNVGGGDANATPVQDDQANAATPQATTMAQAAYATSTTGAPGMEATAEGQAANTPTAQDAAGDQAAGAEAEGTVVSYNNLRTPPDDESVSGLLPVAQSPSPGGTAMPVTLVIELGLALLGVGLAIGAILARRKRA
jgi:hypothetical protein